MQRIRKHIGMRTIKTVIGAIAAVLISQLLNLDYAANSGIIVILSVQSTKKKSKDLAIMRIGSTILALTIGALVFSLMGFSALAFGVYLLVFIPIAVQLKFHDGIVPCSVLVSHLLSTQSVALPALANEMMQMFIGAGIGFLLNLYMPSLEKKIEQDILEIDEMIRAILIEMANCLRTKATTIDEVFYTRLEDKLKESYNRVKIESENRLIAKNNYHLHYMESRIIQFEILYHMRRCFKRLYASYKQTLMVADLTDLIADKLNGLETSEEVCQQINEYRATFRLLPLPLTREEFENRATLYEYINDLEHFLKAKSSIIENMI
ncbi:MAG: aromatic acid exporter family protein [Eubacteriales bacterium]|nr:aromatic acid exporter family protein [Eubacteriales bacterium]